MQYRFVDVDYPDMFNVFNEMDIAVVHMLDHLVDKSRLLNKYGVTDINSSDAYVTVMDRGTVVDRLLFNGRMVVHESTGYPAPLQDSRYINRINNLTRQLCNSNTTAARSAPLSLPVQPSRSTPGTNQRRGTTTRSANPPVSKPPKSSTLGTQLSEVAELLSKPLNLNTGTVLNRNELESQLEAQAESQQVIQVSGAESESESESEQDTEMLERTLTKLRQQAAKEQEQLERAQEEHEHDKKLFSQHAENTNDERREIRRLKEKNEERERIFFSDVGVYCKFMSKVSANRARIDKPPPMFADKFPIFRYLDQHQLLESDNAYELYQLMFNEIYIEPTGSDYDSADVVVPFKINYLDQSQLDFLRTQCTKNELGHVELFKQLHNKEIAAKFRSVDEILNDLGPESDSDSGSESDQTERIFVRELDEEQSDNESDFDESLSDLSDAPDDEKQEQQEKQTAADELAQILANTKITSN